MLTVFCVYRGRHAWPSQMLVAVGGQGMLFEELTYLDLEG